MLWCRESRKKQIERKILSGEIYKRIQLRRLLKAQFSGQTSKAATKSKKRPSLPTGLSANAFLRAMDSKTKDMDLSPEVLVALKKLVRETGKIVDD